MMVTSCLIVACAWLDQVRTSEINKAQLVSILHDARANLRDVEFIFEGTQTTFRFPSTDSRYPESMRLSVKYKKPADMGVIYQGTLAWRNDGSTHLDNSFRPAAEQALPYREIKALVNGTISERRWQLDGKAIPNADQVRDGHIGGLLGLGSPFYLVGFPYLLILLESGTYYQYEFVEWTRVGDVGCVHVKLTSVNPKTGTIGEVRHYWLDLEHGAHVIQEEDRTGDGQLVLSIDDVKLGQVVTKKGEIIWFPVSARVRDYSDGPFVYSSKPIAEVECHIVDGTMKLNQGLGDSRFNLDYGLDDATLAQFQKTKSKTTAIRPRIISTRSDRRKIQEGLDKADTPEAVSSSPARAPWYLKHGYSLIALGVAITVFIVASVLQQRRS